MNTSVPIPAGPVAELASILATGILRLQARAALNSDESPESATASLEVLPPAPLSVTTTRVNAVETTHNERSDV